MMNYKTSLEFQTNLHFKNVFDEKILQFKLFRGLVFLNIKLSFFFVMNFKLQ